MSRQRDVSPDGGDEHAPEQLDNTLEMMSRAFEQLLRANAVGAVAFGALLIFCHVPKPIVGGRVRAGSFMVRPVAKNGRVPLSPTRRNGRLLR